MIIRHTDAEVLQGLVDIPLIEITFVPQNWVGPKRDTILNVDPLGPNTWRVPSSRVAGVRPRTFEADCLAHEPEAPEWVREWVLNYPFEVEWEEPENDQPRHTDAEVLQEIAAIIWPPSNPYRDWDADTMQDVADALLLLRPDLAPWSFNCLVDHDWASNAYDCAERRRYTARVSFVRGTGPREAMSAEEETTEALAGLLYGVSNWNDSDD